MRLVLSISAWWVIWLFISIIGPHNLDSVSYNAAISTLIFVISLILGSSLVAQVKTANPPSRHYYETSAKFSYFILIPFVILQLPLLYAMLIDLLEGVPMKDMRANLFLGQRFSNLEKLVFNWSSGITFNYLLLAGMSYQLLYKKNTFNWLLITCVIISAILKGARGEIYLLIMVSVFLLTILPKSSIKKIIKDYKYQVLWSMLLATISLIGITYLRSGIEFSNQIIDYHAVGFVLFSKYLAGYNCGMIIPTYSVASFFGGIDYLVGLVARQISLDDLHNFSKASVQCQDAGLITSVFTSEVSNREYYSVNTNNAFYTLLVSGYNFMGNLGIAIMGVMFGAILRFLELKTKQGDLIYTHYLILTITILIMGIFGNALDSVLLYFTLIIINIKSIYLKFADRSKISNTEN